VILIVGPHAAAIVLLSSRILHRQLRVEAECVFAAARTGRPSRSPSSSKWRGVMRLKFLTGGLALLIAVSFWQAQADEKPQTKKDADAALRQHGAYLANSVGMCVDCHTQRDDSGKPDRPKQLQGAPITIRPQKETKKWADEAPDITGHGLAG